MLEANQTPAMVYVYSNGHSTPLDVVERLSVYGRGKIDSSKLIPAKLSTLLLNGDRPILLFGELTPLLKAIRRLRKNIFWVDEDRNSLAGWEWCDFAGYVDGSWRLQLKTARSRFTAWVKTVPIQRRRKAYIFGTGPSLSRASLRNWDDGVRIVCNTIVRDKELWNHIKPDIVTAGDGIYHFGFTPHAKAFRRDLAVRLEESNAIFVLPDRFLPMVEHELRNVMERVIPIPIGRGSSIHGDLMSSFELPGLPNVLNLLLLPLGCTLSKHICLWGFDGRAPKDQLFWANSSKQSYPELMEGLRIAHPAFFREQVPTDNPSKYVNAVHGDLLEGILTAAEKNGWRFEMLHKSWTPTLAKRHSNDLVDYGNP